MYRLLLAAGFLVGTARAITADPHSSALVPLATMAEVDAAIARLNIQATRLAALRQLIATSEGELYQVGSGYRGYDNPEEERIAKRAAKAAADAADLQTISAALDSSDWYLQYYGIWFCGITDPKRSPERAASIPKLKKLAVTADANIRAEAVQQLQQLPEFSNFLAQCAREETDLVVIMRLVYGSNGADYNSAMEDAAARLLNRPEESVRCDALGFIAFNSNRAPMWHVQFNRAILDRVVELSKSKSSTERAAAANALSDRLLQHISPADTRAALLKLTADPEADVRWRAIHGLGAYKAEPDVQAAVHKLLHDPSPEVVYFAILADGPARHRPELESANEVRQS